MTPRQILLCTSLIFILGGAILGLQPRTVDDGFDGGADCGSVLRPVDDAGVVTDSITGGSVGATCESKLSGMKPFTYGAFGLAGIAFIAAFVAPAPHPVRSNGADT